MTHRESFSVRNWWGVRGHRPNRPATAPPCYTPNMSARPEPPADPPPFLRTWPRVYAATLVYLALTILACYLFTRAYR